MSTTNNTTDTSQWNISTDIYDIVSTIDNLKARYVDTEDETTLALGIFGFIADTEAKKIQTNTIIAGELGNEMFPNRAKLDKNIVTHAMYSNITNINAVPAVMTVDLAIKESDLNTYMKSDEFVFDRSCPIYVGEYEFHFDYNIILKRQKKAGTTLYYYNASYDMSDRNEISDIVSPYLEQPYTINFNNNTYIFFRTIIRQITISTIEDKLVSGSIIDNKSFTFSFEDQMADFVVYVTEKGNTKKLKPYLYGAPVSLDVKDFCWYLYMTDHDIRIGFDTSSYLPGLNAEIKVVCQTTKGSEGNFSYANKDGEINGFYFDMESSIYNYKKITCYASPETDSENGSDKKSIDELKELIPKMSLSRGYITTETDLNNYFNLINTNENRLQLQKKIDNQLSRIWYCYLLMKNQFNDVLPTNTLDIHLDLTSGFLVESGDLNPTWMLPAGTIIKYDKNVGDYGVPIQEQDMPVPYSDNYYANGVYYYRSIYNILLSTNPLYCSYYLTVLDSYNYFDNEYINPNMFMGFVVTTNHLTRHLLNDTGKPGDQGYDANHINSYTFSFIMRQSVAADFGLYDYETELNTNNMKVIMIVDKDDVPYKYFVGKMKDPDPDYDPRYEYEWHFTMTPDNYLDSDNNLKITNCYELGSSTMSPGYFEDNASARIYILGKFDEDYGRSTIDTMIPDLEGYSLINVYSVQGGLSFYNNLTPVMNTRVHHVTDIEDPQDEGYYFVQGVPFVGAHYFKEEDNVSYFIHELLKKKSYIDHCLTLVENNMDIDFKYFNTYGDSKTYTIGDREHTLLGHIDITMKFRAKFVNQNDTQTKRAIINRIKSEIENLNESGQDLHIPKLIHDLMEEFKDVVVYIEYMNFNDNRLGINHIELKEVDNIHTVPEFICIRNRYTEDGSELEPCIDLEVVQ